MEICTGECINWEYAFVNYGSERAVPMTVTRLPDGFTPEIGIKKGFIDWTDKFSGSVRSLMAAVDQRQVKIPVILAHAEWQSHTEHDHWPPYKPPEYTHTYIYNAYVYRYYYTPLWLGLCIYPLEEHKSARAQRCVLSRCCTLAQLFAKTFAKTFATSKTLAIKLG